MKELILALFVGFVIFLVIRILCGVIAVGFYAGGHAKSTWYPLQFSTSSTVSLTTVNAFPQSFPFPFINSPANISYSAAE